jgi:hypothetical protein
MSSDQQHTAYDAIPASESSRYESVVEALKKENFNISPEVFSKEHFAALKKYVQERDVQLKTMGLVAGAAMVICGFISCMAHLWEICIFQAALDLLIMGTGLVCLILEYKDTFLQEVLYEDISNFIYAELHIVSTPYGRSIVYGLVGLTLITQNDWFETVMGFLVVALGGIIFFSMRGAELALAQMKLQLADEGQLKNMFQNCDLDKDNMLSAKKVAELCSELGSGLTHDELVAALEVLDRPSNRGKISFEAFKNWYAANKV